jgi:hypothetical protein
MLHPAVTCSASEGGLLWRFSLIITFPMPVSLLSQLVLARAPLLLDIAGMASTVDAPHQHGHPCLLSMPPASRSSLHTYHVLPIVMASLMASGRYSRRTWTQCSFHRCYISTDAHLLLAIESMLSAASDTVLHYLLHASYIHHRIVQGCTPIP